MWFISGYHLATGRPLVAITLFIGHWKECKSQSGARCCIFCRVFSRAVFLAPQLSINSNPTKIEERVQRASSALRTSDMSWELYFILISDGTIKFRQIVEVAGQATARYVCCVLGSLPSFRPETWAGEVKVRPVDAQRYAYGSSNALSFYRYVWPMWRCLEAALTLLVCWV